ncbi:hypothetical protein CU669_11050 [Paramagnetospirillum kuznetsovii]|uniref:Chitooligosaccharide deacetylase n=1 Tax=Paramagnetospirillum kuznetsovii TaxID=2053833 RepID=A0A364NXP2_9PROT|nr:polysaccharide deacetylase family protein [Paramagnetospirillum kuznetsovii]RAU21836.1 hypothetical protein CU669_11050 [Paramagnetospirillum kuznetsovii]
MAGLSHPPSASAGVSGARRRVACISIDVEGDHSCPDKRIRLLESRDKVLSLTRLLEARKVPLTVFMVMSLADRYRMALEKIAGAVPTEFAVHSFSHDLHRAASLDEIQRARDEYIRQWGVAPRGYRAPSGLIDKPGLRRLMDAGFEYDSSIFPTRRFDEFGYDNAHYPRMPFEFTHDDRRLMEMPIATLRGIRLPYGLTYVKLLGMGAYRLLLPVFPLPEIAVVHFHPCDLYFNEIANNVRGWKRHAHLRNACNATSLLAAMIDALAERGYEFVQMGQLVTELKILGGLRIYDLDHPTQSPFGRTRA